MFDRQGRISWPRRPTIRQRRLFSDSESQGLAPALLTLDSGLRLLAAKEGILAIADERYLVGRPPSVLGAPPRNLRLATRTAGRAGDRSSPRPWLRTACPPDRSDDCRAPKPSRRSREKRAWGKQSESSSALRSATRVALRNPRWVVNAHLSATTLERPPGSPSGMVVETRYAPAAMAIASAMVTVRATRSPLDVNEPLVISER